MGRPNKYNLHYFPLDVGFFDDHKVISIEETAGIKGGYLALRLMAMVYADQGYFLEWPDKFEYTAAKRIGNGVTGALVAEIFKLCLKYELFNKALFEKYGIVTSAGIQKRWTRVMNDLRRKVVINPDFNLVSSEETWFSSEETSPPAAESTQKETKLKEKKKLQAAIAATSVKINPDLSKKNGNEGQDARRKKFVTPDIVAVKSLFLLQYDPKNPGTWFPDRCNREALDFFDYYKSNGWVQGKSRKPIVDWEAAARRWIRTAKDGTYSNAVTNHGSQPVQKPAAPAPERSNINPNSRAINYQYDQFLEDSAPVTYQGIDSTSYDHLKDKGMITFTEDKIAEIKELAIDAIAKVKIEQTDQILAAYMKKIAVIEFFKQSKQQGLEVIFS